MNQLDIKIIAKRYKVVPPGYREEMVQYEKFFLDYERFEALGLKATLDPSTNKNNQTIQG